MTVKDFLAKRFSALVAHDYTAVYHSYHEDSPFLMQFHSCQDYLAFAEQQLKSIVIKNWDVRDSRQLGPDRVEALLVMELDVGGQSVFFYECALLIQGDDKWRYHSAQKLGVDDYTGSPDQIAFKHFDQVAEKIRF